jgi:hypothetical protein
MTATHTLQTKRVYDPPADGDGTRILIDRIWPRGLTKERATVDLWLKGNRAKHGVAYLVWSRPRTLARVSRTLLRRAAGEPRSSRSAP